MSGIRNDDIFDASRLKPRRCPERNARVKLTLLIVKEGN